MFGIGKTQEAKDIEREASIRSRLLAEIDRSPQNTLRIADLKAQYRQLPYRTLSLPPTDAELAADQDYRMLSSIESAPPPMLSEQEIGDPEKYQTGQQRVRDELQQRGEQAAAIRERLAFKFPERFAPRPFTPPPAANNTAADAAHIMARRLKHQVLAVTQAVSGEQRQIIVRELQAFLVSLGDKNV